MTSPHDDHDEAGDETAAGGAVTTDRANRRCPLCDQPESQSHRPFCSKRCADVDLNRWLKGVYAIPQRPSGDEDD